MTNKTFKEEDIRDAVQFSNFAQKVKMELWQKVDGCKHNSTDEDTIDTILLIAYDIALDLYKQKILEALPKEKMYLKYIDPQGITNEEVDGHNQCLSEVKQIIENI